MEEILSCIYIKYNYFIIMIIVLEYGSIDSKYNYLLTLTDTLTAGMELYTYLFFSLINNIKQLFNNMGESILSFIFHSRKTHF